MTILKKSASASVADDSATLTADEVRRLRVFLRAVGHLTATGSANYTRKNPPPEYAGRVKLWGSVLKTIPGAVQLPTAKGTPGRFWSVSRSAYAAWLHSHGATSVPSVKHEDEPERPWLENTLAGLRLIGGSK